MGPQEPATEPDLVLGPLRIWIRGREFPDAQDFWDGNWLVVEANCSSQFSRATVAGSCIHLSDLGDWLKRLRTLASTGVGEATLGTTQDEIEATVRLAAHGSGEVVVSLRHHATETHEWIADVDPTRVSAWIEALDRVLSRYPIRGAP